MRRHLIGAGVVVFGAAVASPCWAKIELRCYEGPVAVAALKAELKAADQQPVIIGNRTGGNWNVNLFTSDAGGKIGYNIEGNERFGSGKESTTLCVAAKYRSIAINDVSKPGIPAWALIDAATNSRSNHNSTVKHADANRLRIALGAVSVVETANGGERDGPLMLVDFAPSDAKHIGGMLITGTDGIRKSLLYMVDMHYGPRALTLLNR